MSRKVVWIGGTLAAAVVLGAAVAYAVVFNEKVIVNGDLEVRGVGGYADFSLSWVDPFYGNPWMAMRDKGTTPSELEIAPIPNQYDQVTVKTWLTILGKGTAPPGALVDTPPFDARLMMSGPWPDWTYCALRDNGMAPGTLELNPLAQYRDIEATIKDNGYFQVRNATGNLLCEVDSGGGYFWTDSTSGTAVRAYATASSGLTYGFYGLSNSTSGKGVLGFAGASTGDACGGLFSSMSTSGKGVDAFASASTGETYGGHFRNWSTSGMGVYAAALASTGQTYGVHGLSQSTSGTGVCGHASASSGNTYGGHFESDSTSGIGVYGNASATTTGDTYGGYFQADSQHQGSAGVYGNGGYTGVHGHASAGGLVDSYGGYFENYSVGGAAVQASALSSTGQTRAISAYVDSSDGYAGYFFGGRGVYIVGDLFCNGTKNFVQQHPTDPTKEIVYVAIEGPEAATFIRGTGELVDGKAEIALPEHFGLVTCDAGMTVNLTPVGAWLQLYVEQKSTGQLIVREASGKSGTFDYLVQGVRKGYDNFQVVRDRRPEPEDDTHTAALETDEPARSM